MWYIRNKNKLNIGFLFHLVQCFKTFLIKKINILCILHSNASRLFILILIYIYLLIVFHVIPCQILQTKSGGRLLLIKELVVHYSFASQLIRQKVGEDSFDVGRLGCCKACRSRPRTLPSMPRTLQSMPRSVKDVAKHA